MQEAKNGKGKAKIYINDDVEALKEKADSLGGYVTKFSLNTDDIISKLQQENPDVFTA